MGEFWTNRERERKSALLGEHSHLTTAAKQTLRCTECILARADDTMPIDTPGFTANEIERCTGLSGITVRRALGDVIDAGYLVKHAAPSSFTSGGVSKIALYTPVNHENGDAFFTPKTVDGCERTTRSTTLETFTKTQIATLKGIGQVALTDTIITQLGVEGYTGIHQAIGGQVFQSFMRWELLRPISELPPGHDRRKKLYELTDYGRWLIEGIEIEKKIETNSTIRQLIRDIYPVDRQGKVEHTVTSLLHLSILGQKEADSPDHVGNLWFQPHAAHILGKKGCIAVAHWLELSPLMYGQRLHENDIRRLIEVPKGEDTGAYVEKWYFKPMMKDLTENT